METLEQIHIGKLIRKFRLAKNIEKETLYEGLCGETTYVHYEKGTNFMDSLLIHRIFERMGLEADEFAILITEQEYVYFSWMEQTRNALEEENWEELEKLLNQKEIALELECNEKLQVQYYYYIDAILDAVKRENRKDTIKKLKLASQQTIPNAFHLENTLLSDLELHILMLYFYYGAMENIWDDTYVNHLFRQLEAYLSDTNMEMKKRARLYPKLICMWIHVRKEKLSLAEQKSFCEKAIHMLKQSKTMHDITELLRIYVSILKELQEEKLCFYQKYLEVFTAIFEQGNVSAKFQPEVLTGRRKKIFLITEYLRAKRMEKGLTQEKVSETICTPETYSRIETGKRAPSIKNLALLTEKLDINWYRCRGELKTDNLKVYLLRQKERTASLEHRWEDVLYNAQQMEYLLDMKQPINFQYVKGRQVFAKWHLGRIPIEDAYEQYKELLMMTTHMHTKKRFLYYSQTEMEIIAKMAELLRMQKKYEDGITLLEGILKNQQKSKVAFIYQWNGLDFIIRVLGGLYFGAGRYEDANRAKEYSYQINLKIRDADNLGELLDAIADNFEHMGEQYSEIYKELYRQTYYVGDFYGFSHIASFGKQYYEENFDANIKWY